MKNKIKANKAYASIHKDGRLHSAVPDKEDGWTDPIYWLPATREAYEQMVEQMAKGMWDDTPRSYPQFHAPWAKADPASKDRLRLSIVAALAAINIKEPKA